MVVVSVSSRSAELLIEQPTDASANPTGVIIEGRSGISPLAVPRDIAGIARATVLLATEHGGHPALFEGPLLWSLLDRAGAIDTAHPRDHVRQTVVITGRDGYSAILALAEISPEFSAKPVILADHLEGQPLNPDHLRLIVPGETRVGRSVRDVVRITVLPAAPGGH